MQTVTEGATTFVTDSEEKISREMPVFYNPVMKLNRDLSLLVIRATNPKKIALPMEASGVRAARIIHELVEPGFIAPEKMLINDISAHAIEIAKKNATHDSVIFSVSDASKFLLANKGCAYIDIDPFGSPNEFLDAAVKALRKGGVLAITATDTSALAGTYPRATRRKYWAEPSRTWAMHEIGLRILARKVQLIGAQYDKALTPVLSVATDHYYRIFFRCDIGVEKVKDVLKQHACIDVDTERIWITARSGTTGPLWCGALHEKVFIEQLLTYTENEVFTEAKQLLTLIHDECQLDTVGFIDLHEFASKAHLAIPRRDALLQLLGKHGRRTHITPTGIKTDLSREDFVAILQRGPH